MSRFNKDRVNEFFILFGKNLEDNNNLDTTRIYNVDETDLTTVQKKPRKAISRKVTSQVCSISSGERGLNITAVCCDSTAGFYVLPRLIYRAIEKSRILFLTHVLFVKK
jgi:hypothetical protein